MAHPPIEAYEELASTNAEARRRAETGDSGPVWITAARQTAGRGRRGRDWSTGEGNLAATLLMPCAKPPAEAAQISFVAALAAHDLAQACLGVGAASLKWPNDLMIHDRKAAGVLVESGQSASGLWLAVGIGVNLARYPTDVERPATAFAEHMAGHAPAPLAALEVLANAFERWREIWEAQGFPAIANAWTARAHGLGKSCEARLHDSIVAGIAEGLDDDGALRLRLPDGGLTRITAGDVFFGRA
ncbi:MAG: biotin--[acetyl-CoA-carboxylase] ligase [Phenylobacterium sp.]|uniref:biotin--[acetyl-CoA-carboxylase] ligase n=1 Tax=Phenylobacterium sp. TaxID=1871053 RepID=UPI0027359D31|nr:biotin--[acetyl-CoA-carboxylase] ligase [Phenylobacterium sp.]MDP3174016.1 biotin--[acetyl-CoA-carboxylase] ligase [Phenylobacterium sp.]